MEKTGAIAVLAPSTWPDDIIEIIVAQVASSSIGADQLKPLKNCALVSKSFYFPARKHLFATIEFNIDEPAQERAARLCQVLETNTAIIHEITSFIVHSESRAFPAAKLFSPKIRIRDPKLRRTFWTESSLYRLLTCISHAKLQQFAIYSHPGGFDMRKMSASSESLFLAIRSIPSLRSLSLVGVFGIPLSLVIGSTTNDHLRRILLCSSNFQEPSEAPIPRHDPSFNPLSKVEVIEWCCTLHTNFSRVLCPTPANSSSFRAANPFPHLRRYTVRLSPEAEDNAMIWNIILGAAQTLEDLNIRSVAGHGRSSIGLFFLDRLTALQRLTLTTVFEDAVELLASATMATTVETLMLDFHLWDQIDLVFKTAKSEWATLDSILTGPMFKNLRALSFRLTPNYCDPQIDISEISLAKERNTFRVLLESAIPHIMVDNRISVDVDFTARSPTDKPIRCPHHWNTSIL